MRHLTGCLRDLGILGVVVLFVQPRALGQDVDSGPEKGKAVPALKVFDATGPQQGGEIDYAAERKGKPTVYLFIQADQWDRPMARFVRKLDEALSKDGGNAAIVAVWVGGDSDKAKEYLPVAQESLQLQVTTLTVFTGNKGGPDGWGVNRDARLTAVVVRGQKVGARFGYRSINETNVREVHKALQARKKGQK